jgi:hypothetical protein
MDSAALSSAKARCDTFLRRAFIVVAPDPGVVEMRAEVLCAVR